MALALGSGGARGYAHIGVVEAIEARGLEVVTVAGSSMGALVGGLHATGKLAEYSAWATTLTQLDVVRYFDVSLSAPGAIRAERVLAVVNEMLDGVRIEELPIAYTAVATDLLAGREVWFQTGLLATAIRASVAIPGVVTPVMLNGRLLVDGGVLDPIPIAPTAAVHTDLTIAVSLMGDGREPRTVLGAELDVAEERPMDEWLDRFKRGASRMLDSDAARSLAARFGSHPAVGEAVVAEDLAPDSPYDELPAGLGKFDVMSLSLDMLQRQSLRYRLASYPPDVLVAVPRDSCRTLDFHRAGEMIELGRTLADAALDAAGV